MYLSTLLGINFYKNFAKDLNLVEFTVYFFVIFIPIHVSISLILFIIFEKSLQVIFNKIHEKLILR